MHCTSFRISENFDMHSLKQVYLYVICVALYGLIQVQSFVGFEFSKTLNSAFKFALENPFQNLSTFWG